jgi:UDP-GlcNAc:undecaprenyl-phosphate GlcNAc-1-phosphate transferase
MNAVNLVDGQDGLAGGTGSVTALALASLPLAHAAVDVEGIATAGALLGFLVWNRPPARIFLGGGGALGIGVLLAVLAAEAVNRGGLSTALAASVCLCPFAFELVFTIARRLGSTPLSAADRLHSYDLLASLLHGRGRATAVWCGAAALAGGAGLAVEVLPLPAGVAVATAVAGTGALAGRMLWSTRPAAIRVSSEPATARAASGS